ncbi:MAG: response regulator [Planctomycetes bacterium]|nr:response regulator [Planctomycetota bacterium]
MAETLRVLIVEDAPDDVELVVRELRRAGFDVQPTRVESAGELKQALENGAWDVVLSDHNLPQFNAPAALSIVNEWDADLPFIVVSGSIGEEKAVEIMRSGAHDYIMKDNLSRLPEAVRREIKEAAQRRNLKQAQEALRLKDEQLRQAQKLEAVGRLAGGVAHDFNNLLTIIIGRGKLMAMRLDENDSIRKELELILQTAWRASDLTRQLLTFSRYQVVQPRRLDLNEIVRDTQKMLGRLLGEDIEMKSRFEPKLGKISADTGQLSQIILNLAVNARDAMPNGGTLTLATENASLFEGKSPVQGELKTTEYVLLTVQDSGEGMDEETLARIFEPFFTTKGPGKGTGLGLSVVYGIVQQNGGMISVESQPGKGTTFKIYFPRIQETAVPDAAQSVKDMFLPGTETVLLAEDEEPVRELIMDALVACGYKVLPAATGEQALAVSRSEAQAIHLLLTDLIMPKMNGLELAEALLTERPGLKVLYVTGFTEHAVLNQAGPATTGANIMQKPFTPQQLTRKVREVLNAPAPSVH